MSATIASAPSRAPYLVDDYGDIWALDDGDLYRCVTADDSHMSLAQIRQRYGPAVIELRACTCGSS